MSNELQTIETAAPARTVDAVALEIRTLQRQAQGIILSYAIEIGRRLEEAKAMLPHAQNFMRVFREYGDNQQSLFGTAPKSQTFGNLTYSKALRLLAIPDEEERARFVEENNVESMSTRELNEALKARDAAEEEAAAAQDEIRKLKGETARLNDELAGKVQVYEAKLTAAGVEADQAQKKAQAAEEAMEKAAARAQRLQDALSQANTAAQQTEEEHARMLRELEELRNRPATVDTGAVEAARKAAIAEMAEKVTKAKEAKAKAEEKRKAAEEALAAAKEELDALKAKEPEVRELTDEEKAAMTAEAVEKARAESAEKIRSMEKQLTAADPTVSEFKVRYSAWQEDFQKMAALLDKIAQADETRAAKLRQAVKAALARMEV